MFQTNYSGDKPLIRQDYSRECEEAVNHQINFDLHASYVFLAMSCSNYDDPVVNDDTISDLNQFLSNQSDLYLLHAQMLMQYQRDRGGHIVLQDIKKPKRDKWGTGLEACDAALELAREVNGSLLGMRRVARKNGDRHTMDFINDNLLQKQVQSIHVLSVLLTKLKRSAEGYGD